jgi:hypothetical protein
MAAIGTLTIEMAANVARLQRDMDRASKSVDGAMEKIKKAAGLAKAALGALGIGLGVAALSNYVKNAINAADETSKLAQKIGVAVKDVGGLQLAFRQSGLGAGELQQSMARLAQGITGGNKALEAMSIQTRNADGSLKNTRQVLGEVADRFASYEDGAAKSALAIELFGKTGAQLIPLLNGGSEGLDNFDKMAQKLGLTLTEETAKAAEQFNDTLDLIKAAGEGVSMQVMGQLLPTLQSLAGSFFNALTEGDRLSKIAQVLGVVLKGLGSIVIVLVETILTASTAIKTFGEAMLAIVRGDFKGAVESFVKGGRNIRDSWVGTLDNLKGLWSDTGDASVASMAATMAAVKKLTPEIQKAEKETYKLTEAQKFYNREIDEYFAAEEKRVQAMEKAIRTGREMIEDISFETKALQMTNKEREIAIRLRKLEAEGIKEGSAAYKEFEERLRAAITARDAVQEGINQQQRYLEEWKRTADEINRTLTDSLMRAFESGKGFGKAFKDTIVNMFRTMVLRPILAPIVGGLTAGMTGSAAASTGIDIISGTQTAFNMLVGGLNSVGATVSSALLRAGDYLATSSIDAVAAGGEFLQTISAGAGTIASTMAGYAVGEFARNLIGGGYSLGKGMDNFQRIGIAVASFIGGPVLGAIVGALQGVFNRAFGRKLADVGIQGMFGAEGFAGQSFTFEKGGWFRSDKTSVSGLDQELQAFFGQSFQSIQAATAVMAATLGQNAEEIFNFTKSIRLSFMGLNQEQIQNLVKETFEGLADDMAKLALGTDQFTRQGERASETLSRLYNSIFGVNAVLDTLNLNMLDFSLAGADAASQLVDLFGGIDQLRQATGAYYEAFYTDVERTEISLRQLTTTFGSLGLSLPETREQFRQLVEAQDLTTEAGRQMFASLINLAPAFDGLQTGLQAIEDAAMQAAQAQEKLAQAELEAARAARILEEQAAAMTAQQILQERLSLETRLLQLQGDTQELRNRELASTNEANRALLQRIFLLQDEQEAQAELARQQQEAQSISNERFSLETRLLQLQGDTVSLRKRELLTLDESNRALLKQIFALEDQQQAERELAEQMEIEERQRIEVANRMARALEEAKRKQEQYIQSLERAGDSIQQEILRLRGLSGIQSLSAAQSQFAILTAQARAGSAEAAAQLPELSKIISQIALETGGSRFDILRIQSQLAGSLETTLGALSSFGAKIPRYQSGGITNGGLALVGEAGPELVNFNKPAAIYSSQRTSNMIGGEEVAFEVRSLREENRNQSRAIIALQTRMTRLLEQWDGDGLPEERVVA